MKKFKNICVALLLSLVLVLSACSTNVKETGEFSKNLKDNINVSNLEAIIKELADEKYDGRLTGTEENLKAAEYIADYFKEIGLESPVGAEDYMQYYFQGTNHMKEKSTMVIMDSNKNIIKEFENIDDFYVNVSTYLKINGNVEGELYYINSIDLIMGDIQHLQEKIVLLPKDVYIEVRNTMGTEGILQREPNIGALICERDKEDPAQVETGYFTKMVNVPRITTFNDNGAMVVFCDTSTFEELREASENSLYTGIEAHYEILNKRVPNVLGLIPGNDPKLKDQYIIISAHFDHLGNNLNGSYNPGAFDNCSGVSVMLEIARILKEGNIKPKKSILFVAFNGEENGLYGSRSFSHNPPCDLRKAEVINLDMVAHKKDNPITFDYTIKSDLTEKLKGYAKDLNINYSEKVDNRSDHATVAEAGAQAVTIIEWELDGYHHPNDIPDIIDYEEIKKITEFLLTYISNEGL